MNDFNFEESISAGIQRADVAEANKLEISEVFSNFSQAFQNASNGKIHSEIKSKQRKVYSGNNPLMILNSNYEKYQALVLSNNSSEYSIAEVIENDDGYPIRIKIKDDTSSYSDKDGLIAGLSRLASRTEVGKYFKSLLQDDI